MLESRGQTPRQRHQQVAKIIRVARHAPPPGREQWRPYSRRENRVAQNIQRDKPDYDQLVFFRSAMLDYNL
jgi:hypothetical protein